MCVGGTGNILTIPHLCIHLFTLKESYLVIWILKLISEQNLLLLAKANRNCSRDQLKRIWFPFVFKRVFSFCGCMVEEVKNYIQMKYRWQASPQATFSLWETGQWTLSVVLCYCGNNYDYEGYILNLLEKQTKETDIQDTFNLSRLK